MRPLTVLLTGCGAPGTPGTLYALRTGAAADGYALRVVGVDARDDTPGRFLTDAFHAVPRADAAGYVHSIAAVCERERVDVILPQTTAEVEVLSRTSARRLLLDETGARVAAADGYAVRAANDKGAVMEAFRRLGLPAPAFERVGTRATLSEAARRLGYPRRPVVVKPPRGNGSRGVRVVMPEPYRPEAFESEKPDGMRVSLDVLYRQLGADFKRDLLVMEYLSDPEYSVDVFRGVRAEAAVCRRRIETRSGIATRTAVERNADMEAWSLAAARHLGLFGAMNFQFRLDAAGVPKVIECNPRVAGTMVCSVLAGLNAPWFAVREEAGDPITHIEITSAPVEYVRQWAGVGFVSGVPAAKMQSR